MSVKPYKIYREGAWKVLECSQCSLAIYMDQKCSNHELGAEMDAHMMDAHR